MHRWVSHFYQDHEHDESLASERELIINTKLESLGLKYNTTIFGDIKIDSIKLRSGCDGILMPKSSFTYVPESVDIFEIEDEK